MVVLPLVLANRIFLKEVDDYDGIVLPVAVTCNILAVQDMSSSTENILVLSLSYTKYIYITRILFLYRGHAKSVLENVFISDGQRFTTHKGIIANQGTCD